MVGGGGGGMEEGEPLDLWLPFISVYRYKMVLLVLVVQSKHVERLSGLPYAEFL